MGISYQMALRLSTPIFSSENVRIADKIFTPRGQDSSAFRIEALYIILGKGIRKRGGLGGKRKRGNPCIFFGLCPPRQEFYPDAG